MAKLKGALQFTGSIGDLSAYTRKGSDKVILRRKGGPSKRQIDLAPEFTVTRYNISEFSACSKMSSAIRQASSGIKELNDFNTCTALNAINKILQKNDTESEFGKRAIYLARYSDLLVGFNFNKEVSLSTMLSATIPVTINRAALSTQLTVPRLIPNINIKQFGKHTMYRLIATIGIVSDIVYNAEFDQYLPVQKALHGCSNMYITQWHPANQMQDMQTLTVSLPYSESLTDSETIIVGFGIEYGNQLSDSIIKSNKNAGFAKIIAVG